MQSQNRIFDDLARVAGGALSALTSVKDEIEAMIRDRLERFMAEGNFVRREEFEVVRAMASEARAEQERLAQRVAALEAALSVDKSSVRER
ncbi:MAG: accessory factor UbiK family protein [Candidatus Binataceae bacterium]